MKDEASMTAICPQCGTENPPAAMNCQHCRINLEFARANPEIAKGLTREFKPENVVAEFPPSKQRYFARVAILLGVSALITLSLGYLLFRSALLGGFLAAVFWIMLKEYFGFHHQFITISDETISGPAASGGKMVSIALGQIDRQKTVQRGRLLRAEGSWYVYSTNGDRLILSSMAFDKHQIRAILSMIGVAVEQRKG